MNLEGNPDDYLSNLLEYRDIDRTTEFFSKKLSSSLVKIIPKNTSINTKTLAKNIRRLLEAKGTEDSFKFVMNTIFDEAIEFKWGKDYVFSASNNDYVEDLRVAIEGSEFQAVDGLLLEQDSVSAVIESNVYITHGGSGYNVMSLNSKTLIGEFIAGSPVRILKSNIDRNFISIENYYSLVSVSANKISVFSPSASRSSISGLMVRQLDSGVVAKVAKVDTKSVSSGIIYTLNLDNVSGVFNTNEIYFVAEAYLYSHYTKNDFYYGIVSPMVTGVEFKNRGQYYNVGDVVEFYGETGSNASARVSQISGGPIEEIDIISGGSGYSVGDVVVDSSTSGQGLIAKVENIDGVGAVAEIIMEVDDIQIIGQTTNVSVGDTFELISSDIDRLIISITSVSATGNITGYTISNRGSYLICPHAWSNKLSLSSNINLLLEDNSALLTEKSEGFLLETADSITANIKYRIKSSKVFDPGHSYSSVSVAPVGGIGSGANLHISYSDGVITSVPVLSGGSGYTRANIFAVGTGSGFSAICNIVSGQVSSISIINGGSGYTAGTVFTIVGTGSGATLNSPVYKNGVISSVTVTDSGQDYSYDTTISYTTSNVGAAPCSLKPIIKEGKITSVSILFGGFGYTDTNNSLTINSGSPSVLSASVSSGGSISGVKLLSGGSGYYDPTEIPPISIALVSSFGSGSVLIPIIENGVIVSVKIVNPGNNYLSNDTISVTGGLGSGAELYPTIMNGQIINVFVKHGGSGYFYGTKLYLLGDGKDFNANLVVNTGLNKISVKNGGSGYLQNTIMIVSDSNGPGSGAVIRPEVINGAIANVSIISTGSNYVSPVITIIGSGSGAEIHAFVDRNIVDVVITNHGANYSGAEAFLLGEGTGAFVSPEVNGFGKIISISSTPGSGYTSTPIIEFSDTSGVGTVSKIKIESSGQSYRTITPTTIIDSVGNGFYGRGKGKEIGSIKEIEFIDFGFGYEDPPRISFPSRIEVNNNSAFKIGEKVRIDNRQYVEHDGLFGLLTENSELLELEESAYNILYDEEILNNFGPEMIVRDLDYSTNTILFQNSPEDIDLTDERGYLFITENSGFLEHESSSMIYSGDVLVGQKSFSVATVKNTHKAEGIAVVSGQGFNKKRFTNSTGRLNNIGSKIHNNDDIQHYSYTLVSGLSQKIYEKTLKDIVHPAGFNMFGEVRLAKVADDNLTVKIPGNIVFSLFAIVINLEKQSLYRLNSDTRYNYEWLEQNKFRLSALDYGYILDSFDDNLITEDGFVLVGDGMTTLYGGHTIDYFGDYTFDTIIDGLFVDDLSCEIDILSS